MTYFILGDSILTPDSYQCGWTNEDGTWKTGGGVEKMSPEHKQQAMDLLEQWRNTGNEWEEAEIGLEMAILLQQIVNEPDLLVELVQAKEAIVLAQQQYAEDGKTIAELKDKLKKASTAAQHLDMVKDAERYRWLRNALSTKTKAGKSHHFCSIQRGKPEELDEAIDAAIAAEKGGA